MSDIIVSDFSLRGSEDNAKERKLEGERQRENSISLQIACASLLPLLFSSTAVSRNCAEKVIKCKEQRTCNSVRNGQHGHMLFLDLFTTSY